MCKYKMRFNALNTEAYKRKVVGRIMASLPNFQHEDDWYSSPGFLGLDRFPVVVVEFSCYIC